MSKQLISIFYGLVLFFLPSKAFSIEPILDEKDIPDTGFNHTSFLLKDSFLEKIISKKEIDSEEKAFMFFALDTDGDTVDDITDLDDDNDGILDEIENSCSLVSGYDGYWEFDNDGAVDLSGEGHDLQNSPTLVYNSTEIKTGTHSLDFDGT